MSQIRILSEHLANQIAAGEVVERPASVVKELVENSLDSGAGRVDVFVEGGGAGLLRVADNGCGMDGDDVLLCLERHATSKLRQEGDLAAVATLGFRGEALPSIASVSWMSILSRPRGQELGARAEIRYGRMREAREAGCAQGTVIEVRHLFGNLPARKKFLKSARTELHHIEEVIKNHALAHPEVGFRLSIDGRMALEYREGADLERRVREVFRYREALLRLRAEAETEDGPMRLGGFLLLPQSSPAGAARLRILVNRRPVQDAMIRHAVQEGLRGFLMKGYQPAGALLLEIPAAQVDVNVHPAKREIRFRRAEGVHRFLAREVAAAMAAYQGTLRDEVFAPGRAREEGDVWEGERPAWTGPETSPLPLARLAEPPVAYAAGASFSQEESPGQAAALPPGDVFLFRVPEPCAAPFMEAPPAGRTASMPADADFQGLRLVGQLFSLYLLCEGGDRFVVIDQHAAHERLLYTELRRAYLQSQVPRQALLFPATAELRPEQAATLEQRAEEVERLGLETSFFGGDTWVIKTLPAAAGTAEPGALLREVLDSLRGLDAAEAGASIPAPVEEVLAAMACKAAIKAGHSLSAEEMLGLLQKMEEGEVFSHCPHGRPVLRVFSAREVEQWFHRHGG